MRFFGSRRGMCWHIPTFFEFFCPGNKQNCIILPAPKRNSGEVNQLFWRSSFSSRAIEGDHVWSSGLVVFA